MCNYMTIQKVQNYERREFTNCSSCISGNKNQDKMLQVSQGVKNKGKEEKLDDFAGACAEGPLTASSERRRLDQAIPVLLANTKAQVFSTPTWLLALKIFFFYLLNLKPCMYLFSFYLKVSGRKRERNLPSTDLFPKCL